MSGSNRDSKFLGPIFLIIILAVSMFAVYLSFSTGSQTKADPNAYVGIAFGGNTTVQAKQLIDKVKSYTNPVSYTHLRAHETDSYLVCRLLLEKKKKKKKK